MPTPDFSIVEDVMQRGVPALAPAAQLVVHWQGEQLLRRAYGWLDPEARRQPVTDHTLFDLASLTKPFAATTFMTLVEGGQVGLDQPVGSVLPEFGGVRQIEPYENPLVPGELVRVVETPSEVDLDRVTFRHLLAHTSGLPAWRPLFRQGSAQAARQMALEAAPAYPPGEHSVYSDIGMILLGMAIERLAGESLDRAVARRVTEPLGLLDTRYLPIDAQASLPTDVAPTEVCGWRGRRIQGEVHDENAASLGGVSGHAGLFSTATDVARFGQAMLEGGAPMVRPETVAEMTREQAVDGAVRRGLGFALWSPDPEASGHPFSPRAFGHTGFTGTSIWVDPERRLVVALLTNEVYGGREGRGIGPLRIAAHRAIVEAVDAATSGEDKT
jgi:CubicO group peptidase (beta-lactamase class C family)